VSGFFRIGGRKLKLKKLDSSFYTDNPHIPQALDYDMKAGTWSDNKIRGHGIVQVHVNGLIFAIPVRSNISHSAAKILERNKDHAAKSKGMGLDYSKALLIRNAAHITADVFVLRSKEAGRKLVGIDDHVTKQFSSYVERYIAACKKNDRNILNSAEYRYTTLINYHTELELD
jgi:protein AbiQ